MPPQLIDAGKMSNCLFCSLFRANKAIALRGDGRCDSPGHSAKYGAYHLVELDLNKVLVVELVQVSITFLRLHFMQSTLIFVITVYAPVQSNHEK